jgi:hypothetical protein
MSVVSRARRTVDAAAPPHQGRQPTAIPRTLTQVTDGTRLASSLVGANDVPRLPAHGMGRQGTWHARLLLAALVLIEPEPSGCIGLPGGRMPVDGCLN